MSSGNAPYIVSGVHAASRAGKTAKIIEYLKSGGDANKLDKENCSPLMWACWGGHLEIVKALLEHGAEVAVSNHQGASALHWACWGGHLDIVRVLIDWKAPLDGIDEQDGTPLHYAAKKGFSEVAQALIAAGAQVDPLNGKAMTPLHLACHSGRIDLVRFLLTKKASVQCPDQSGRTALHYAALKCHLEEVQLLVSHGAILSVRDNSGKTPHALCGQSATRKTKIHADAICKLICVPAERLPPPPTLFGLISSSMSTEDEATRRSRSLSPPMYNADTDTNNRTHDNDDYYHEDEHPEVEIGSNTFKSPRVDKADTDVTAAEEEEESVTRAGAGKARGGGLAVTSETAPTSSRSLGVTSAMTQAAAALRDAVVEAIVPTVSTAKATPDSSEAAQKSTSASNSTSTMSAAASSAESLDAAHISATSLTRSAAAAASERPSVVVVPPGTERDSAPPSASSPPGSGAPPTPGLLRRKSSMKLTMNGNTVTLESAYDSHDEYDSDIGGSRGSRRSRSPPRSVGTSGGGDTAAKVKTLSGTEKDLPPPSVRRPSLSPTGGDDNSTGGISNSGLPKTIVLTRRASSDGGQGGGGSGGARPSVAISSSETEEIQDVAIDMALELIITDMEDLEERVQGLTVDGRANEGMVLTVTKRVDDLEREVRKMKKMVKKSTTFSMSGTGVSAGGGVGFGVPESSGGSSHSHPGQGLAGTPVPVGSVTHKTGNSNNFNSTIIGEITAESTHAKMREVLDRLQDKEEEIDRVKASNRALRERMDERDVEVRYLQERIAKLEEGIANAQKQLATATAMFEGGGGVAGKGGGCNCLVM